jgi:signal transduction histidine kinase
MNTHLVLTAEIRHEHDVVYVRQRARQLAALLEFDGQEQTRLATAVSEIARNAYDYGGGGRAEFAVDPDAKTFVMRIIDQGRGIADLERILTGRYESPTGMGLGIVGARRLTDRLDIVSAPGRGTTVTLVKRLPARIGPVTREQLADVARAIAAAPRDSVAELQAQNQELLRSLDEVQRRRAEVERLNLELEETNRGVLALYAELDDRAAELARASELKSRFLSNISHELRTPLNSILNVTRLLLDRLDGPLTVEQERQVALVRGSANSLVDIVNDLLDLARIEAGKTVLRLGTFPIEDLVGALRGMMRPLMTSDAVVLLMDPVPAGVTMYSDEGRVSQILRNLLANAVKFTERGEIRLGATVHDERVIFTVADSGIGIAQEDIARIFEEFGQVETPLQRHAVGSGLGLPLSRQLAQLLGGTLLVESTPGAGSVFTLDLPRVFGDVTALPEGLSQHHTATSETHA